MRIAALMLLASLACIATASDDKPDWYVLEKTEQITADGKTAAMCTRAAFTPTELIAEANEQGWKYKINESASEVSPGKPSVIEITLILPGGKESTVAYFRQGFSHCKRTATFAGFHVTDTERYK